MPARNIDEVLERLDYIIETSLNNQDPHGAFAALYRRVTAAVKEGIAAGQFDDGPRMERLDVVFANRYLDAWEARKAGQPVTQAWAAVFETAGQGRKLLLQHLLLGMNAHINLDLGIAAVRSRLERSRIAQLLFNISKVIPCLSIFQDSGIGVVLPIRRLSVAIFQTCNK